MRNTWTLAAFLLMFLWVMVGYTQNLEVPVAEEMSAEQREIWQMEEVYWEYVKALDVEGYKTLWHEDFVGWPSFSDSPVGKANIGDWIQEYKNKGMTVTSELRPRAVQFFGDVAVTHYLVSYVRADNQGNKEGEGQWWRITHTWKRYGERWEIVGGMSAPHPGHP